MRDRRRKGQGIVLIILIVIAVIVVFAVLSSRSSQIQSAPVVQTSFWQLGSGNVTVARIGDEVEAHVIVEATQEYVGSIIVKVKKDVAFWVDSDYSVKTVPVNLGGGQSTELELTFVPDQASEGRLRGYFVEVDFTVTRTDWVMENSYPPRLSVRLSVPPTNL